MATADILQTRPMRGSRISSFYPVKTMPPLSSLDSAFQLQEYISLLIRRDVHDVNTIVSVPDSGSKAGGGEVKEEGGSGEEGRKDGAVDESCWMYEQLRRLAQDLSHPLITMLQLECTRSSCPEMKAGEWLYLCVAHGNDGAMEQCCAIDYILHTLDSATALLNSPRAFPSRLQIPTSSYRHFSSLARRLGRIFAHAYFHHREAFEQAEAESSLYARFLALTAKFDLVPAEFLVIPSSSHGEGAGEGEGRGGEGWKEVQPPRLLGAAPIPHDDEADAEGGGPGPKEDRDRSSNSNDSTSYQEGGPPGLSNQGSDLGSGFGSGRGLKGRNRTDTMVFSEGYNVAEEIASRTVSSSSGSGSGGKVPSASSIFSDEGKGDAHDEEEEGEAGECRAYHGHGDTVPDSPLERTEHRVGAVEAVMWPEEERQTVFYDDEEVEGQKEVEETSYAAAADPVTDTADIPAESAAAESAAAESTSTPATSSSPNAAKSSVTDPAAESTTVQPSDTTPAPSSADSPASSPDTSEHADPIPIPAPTSNSASDELDSKPAEDEGKGKGIDVEGLKEGEEKGAEGVKEVKAEEKAAKEEEVKGRRRT
ncbi:Mob1/phocein [Pterulicium gracile]|uniref:Mob1/phocein n=1 Tax=Pterulicium gracile TaxID=1884261 RepID=A0A5C3Q8M2_9AGAR|nr:Mob1/phocein [Pterula gracilis]